MLSARPAGRRGYCFCATMLGDKDISAHERWAKDADVQELLAYMLAQPFADHSTAVRAVLTGELRHAHAAGLLRASSSLDFTKSKWRGSLTRNKGVAYHTWLYHFLGGAEAKLLPPPALTSAVATQWSSSLRRDALVFEADFKREVERIEKAIKRAADPSRYMAELLELRCRVVDPERLRAASEEPMDKSEGSAAQARAAAAGGADPTPTGSDEEQQRHTDALRAFAMGTHEREVQVLRAGMWLEHREKQGWRELAEERGVQLEQALADAARAFRREAQAHAQAGATRQQFDEFRRELQEDSTAWRAAVERESDKALKDQRAAAAARALREQKREYTELWASEREQRERAEAETVRAKEDIEGDRRETLARYRQRELEADAARAQVEQALAELESQHAAQLAAMERLRNARNGSALERQAALEAEVQRLKARRKATQLKVSDANLARRATAVAQQQLQKERTVLRDFWGSGLDYAARAKEIELENAALVQKLKDAQADLKAAQGEAAKYRAVAEPGKAKFFEAGHFSAAVDQIIVECLSLGVARNKLPQLFVIFARFYGILISGR